MSDRADKGEAGDPLDRILAEQVYAGGEYKPFAELSLEEVEARAVELREAAQGPGPMQARVGPVAAVWEGLASVMREREAASVADLDREVLATRADRLWVVPPGGSFL